MDMDEHDTAMAPTDLTARAAMDLEARAAMLDRKEAKLAKKKEKLSKKVREEGQGVLFGGTRKGGVISHKPCYHNQHTS